MNSTYAVELKGVVKRYNEILAVNQVDLTINTGEIFGLLGPNGSGKSTTMKMLLGLVQPDAGSVTVLGTQVQKDPVAVKQQIGYVPEAPRLYEFLTGIEYLDFIGDVYGMQTAEKKKRISEYLKALQLEGREGDMITSYSEGMKQKIAIARALIHDPKYIFLDEPTASLDPVAAKIVREYILELKLKGNTILINTHNLAEAERICDTVALVKNRTVKIGNPKELAKGLFTRRISITMQNIPSNLLKEIEPLGLVSQAQVKGNQLIFNVKNPEEDNPQVLSWLFNQRLKVQFVSEEEHSLEDVYLKLIEEAVR